MIRTVALIGGGVIGAGWAARLIENGIDVVVADPAPGARDRIETVLGLADRAYAQLLTRRGPRGSLRMAGSIAEAVAAADWIIESVPERPDIKRAVYAEIEAADATTPIASSTSGILPTDLQADMAHPDRLLVAHPFVPVYLLPVVEIVGGEKTSAEVIARAMAFYPTLGMRPIHIRKEIEAFVADRLLEAIWRESLWLIKDGICTTQDLDDIVRLGFGLRCAQLGVFDTYRVAGGEAGMRHFLAQFGPCLQWPWTKLTNVPEFNDDLVDLIAGQSDAQSGHMDIRDLERQRDDNLVGILHALRGTGWGAGAELADHEARLAKGAETPSLTGPLPTYRQAVPKGWTDYNGHMNEARYGDAFSAASDRFMEMIGCDADYIARGGSYFTAENHVRYLAEAHAGDEIHATTQWIGGEGRKLHLFHRLWRGETELATCETMLLHVSLATRAVSDPGACVTAKLAEIIDHHRSLPAPEGLGRAIGQRR